MAETTQSKLNDPQGENTAAPLSKDDVSTFLKDYKEYLAYQVAEAARQQLVSWAKWIVGVIALFITILGVKAFYDAETKINEAIQQELVKAQQKTKEALDRFTTETNDALNKLKAETELVKNQAEQAGALIAEQTTQVKSQYTLFMGALPSNLGSPAVVGLNRLIYDANHKEILPGTLVRSEGSPPSSDETVDEVYNNIAILYKFMDEKFGVKLFPGNGKVIATVHYGVNYDNRFWDGNQLVLGDGDGKIFVKFSGLDTIAGALVYSMIQEKTKLPYSGQQGALVTHLSDVIAVMVDQYHRNQVAESASWLIGADMLSTNLNGALRSLKAPGTAYENQLIGKDSQPSHMKNYVRTATDNGGVHLNGGIPNHAFYLAAVTVGGFSWEKIGMIWIKSMDQMTSNTDFKDFAKITLQTAETLYGADSTEAKAVAQAWSDVGISLQTKQTGGKSGSDGKAKRP